MMISKRTATITMIPMMIFLMATGACANCNPFWSTDQIAAPTTVPIASTRNGFSICSKLPSLSNIPALAPQPSTVPSVEKKSPQNVIKINGIQLNVKIDLKSKLKMIF